MWSRRLSYAVADDASTTATTTTASSTASSSTKLEAVEAATAAGAGSGTSSYYALLRYEDFALEPLYRATVLFQWLGLVSSEGALPRPIASWLERATNAKRADGDFGTSRTDSRC